MNYNYDNDDIDNSTNEVVFSNYDPIWPCGNDPGNNPPIQSSLCVDRDKNNEDREL